MDLSLWKSFVYVTFRLMQRYITLQPFYVEKDDVKITDLQHRCCHLSQE